MAPKGLPTFPLPNGILIFRPPRQIRPQGAGHSSLPMVKGAGFHRDPAGTVQSMCPFPSAFGQGRGSSLSAEERFSETYVPGSDPYLSELHVGPVQAFDHKASAPR